MSEVAVEVTDIYKEFKIYKDFFLDRLKEQVFFWNCEKYYRTFRALDNISLRVRKGEVLGIIGPNGAGKSTLLKLLAGISYPTSGKIHVKGSLVAVLALGLGFNQRFTGRENITVGATMLGMSRSEIKRKEDWIIKFAELENFIDQPLRTYSTGMQARLSFAVAASVSPDILIIDEALATGDSFFVQKSLGRIHEICKEGATAIFVSHNLQQIQRLCPKRVILLENGRIVNDDIAANVIKQYEDLIFKYRERESQRINERFMLQIDSKDYHGNGAIIIEDVIMKDSHGRPVKKAKTGEHVSLHLKYRCVEEQENVKIIVHFFNYSGICAYAFQSDNYYDQEKRELNCKLFHFVPGRGEVRIDFHPILLTTNDYYIGVTLYDYENLLNADASFLDSAIFIKKHIAYFSIHKQKDLNNTLIYENPVNVTMTKDDVQPCAESLAS